MDRADSLIVKVVAGFTMTADKIIRTRRFSNILIVSVLVLVLVTGVLVGVDWRWTIIFGGAFVTLLCLIAPLPWLLVVAIATSSLIVYRWDIGVGQLSLYRIFLLLYIFRLCILYFTRRARPRVDTMLLLLAMLVVWDILGALYSADSHRGLRMAFQEVEFLLAYFAVLNSGSSLRTLAMQTKAFIVSVVLAIGFGFWQWLNVFVWKRPFQWPLWQYVRIDEEARWLGVTGVWSPGVERVGSVLADPANFAILLALSLLVIITFIFWERQISTSNILFLFGAGIMLFASGGRIGLFNSLIGVIVLLIFLFRVSRHFPSGSSDSKILWIVALLFGVGIGSLILSRYVWGYDLWGELYERISTDVSFLGVYDDGRGSSLGRRLFLLRMGLKAWAASPLLGVGTGGLLAAYGILGVHNTWVLRLAENGIIGFAIVASITFLVLKKAVTLFLKIQEPAVSSVLLSREDAKWAVAFIYSAPVLAIQLLIAWMLWGYWWQPFYILVMAWLVMADDIVRSVHRQVIAKILECKAG